MGMIDTWTGSDRVEEIEHNIIALLGVRFAPALRSVKITSAEYILEYGVLTLRTEIQFLIEITKTYHARGDDWIMKPYVEHGSEIFRCILETSTCGELIAKSEEFVRAVLGGDIIPDPKYASVWSELPPKKANFWK